MREIKTESGHSIVMYDSIDEMPITRYHKFNQMMVIATGVGSDLQSLMEKITTIRKYVSEGMDKKADAELLNLYQTYYFTLNSVDPKSVAFACLVKSVDGEEQTEVTEDAIRRLSERLNEMLLKSERDNALEGIKKKLKKIWHLISRKRRMSQKK